MQNTSIAGNSLELIDTTLDSENFQDTRGNDLGHSKNSIRLDNPQQKL